MWSCGLLLYKRDKQRAFETNPPALLFMLFLLRQGPCYRHGPLLYHVADVGGSVRLARFAISARALASCVRRVSR